jgi:hypothetical protein
MIAEKIALDSLYFDAFGKRIDEQIAKTKDAILLMQQLGGTS